MQKKFKISSHIVDAKLSVESKSLETLFQNSLWGMNELLKKDFCRNIDGTQITSEIEIYAYSSTSLLLNFLSEILMLSHSTHVIFCTAKFMTLSENYLLARVSGSKIDKFDRNLKSVSYHEAEITKNNHGNLAADIVFDYR